MGRLYALAREGKYLCIFYRTKSLQIAWYRIRRHERLERLEKLRFHPVSKYPMRCECRYTPSSLLSGISCCFDEGPTTTDMVIDDPDISPFDISSLEVHLDLSRRLTDLRTRDDLVVSEKSGKCLLRSRIWKEDNRKTPL